MHNFTTAYCTALSASDLCVHLSICWHYKFINYTNMAVNHAFNSAIHYVNCK